MILTYLAVMAGGAIGVGVRMAVSGPVAAYFGESFPWGTILVNVTGCFLIGVFAGLTGPDAPFLVSPLVRQTVMIGVLGGFTTYSSFSLQTLTLLSDGQLFAASANVVGTLVLCLAATWGGLMIAGVAASK